MVNVVRYEPLGDILNAVFSFPADLHENHRNMKINVQENDKEYVVYADLPGVRKEDVQITVDGSDVTISAERKQEKEKQGEDFWRRESTFGKVSRRFKLPHNIDKDNSAAKIVDGVLELHLLKHVGSLNKQITVS